MAKWDIKSSAFREQLPNKKLTLTWLDYHWWGRSRKMPFECFFQDCDSRRFKNAIVSKKEAATYESGDIRLLQCAECGKFQNGHTYI